MPSLLSPRLILEQDWCRRPTMNGTPGGQRKPFDAWDTVHDRLATFRALEENWDGQGARAPSGELLDSALALTTLLRDRGVEAPSGAAPGPMGTVLLVWQGKDGTYCEVEVERPFYAEVMLVEPGKPARHWVLPEPA